MPDNPNETEARRIMRETAYAAGAKLHPSESRPTCTRGVYKILNTATGDFYIGASRNIEQRWLRHKSDLRLQRHKNARLQAAWNEHGADKFTLHVMEQVPPADDLLAAEQRHMDDWPAAYNMLAPGALPRGAPMDGRTRKPTQHSKKFREQRLAAFLRRTPF